MSKCTTFLQRLRGDLQNTEVVPVKFSEKLRIQVSHICHKVALTTENSLVKPLIGRGKININPGVGRK